jgi:hypothetical protein
MLPESLTKSSRDGCASDGGGARNRLRTANARIRHMPRARRPVRCRSCGFVTKPVSGFCPNCLERLPRGAPPWVLALLIAGLAAAGAIALAGPALVAPAIALHETEATRAPATSSALASPTAVAGSTGPAPSISATPSTSGSNPARSAAPSAAPSSSPPTAVLGVSTMPSTSTLGEVQRAKPTYVTFTRGRSYQCPYRASDGP